MVSFILPGNSASGSYEVANSARFTAASTGHLERTFNHAGNRKVWTFSTWIKRSVLGVERGIFGSAINSSGTDAVNAIFFHTADTIKVWTQNGETAIVSSELFRDPSAWLHLVWTAQSSSPYYKVYVNGSEINYGTDQRSTYPSTNDSEINQNNVIHYIGGWKNGSDQSVSSYMADTYFLDGYTYDASYFGEADEDSGIWKPKKYAEGNYGNNGFHLEYKETGTSANSSGIGADTSGNDNHFTPQNMTAEDISTDTPTNNFATMNALDNYHADGTFSNGNLEVTSRNTGYTYNTSTFGVNTGKWYWEVKWSAQPTGSSNQVLIGIAKRPTTSSTIWLGSQLYTYGYLGSDGHVKNNNGNATGSSATTYSVGDIISVALDLDNNKLHFAKNGSWTNSSDPAGNSGGVTITAPDSTDRKSTRLNSSHT